MKIENTVRGIVVHDGKLLSFRLAPPADTFWCLPGGRVEPNGEDLYQSMEREMVEETGIKPDIGKLLFVHQFFGNDDKIRIEFFFEIKNGADYLNIDLSKTTHGFELTETAFLEPATTDKRLLPAFLKESVPQFIKEGADAWQTKVVITKAD